MNYLEDDFQMKTSWIENRAGLESRKIKTSANYIRGTAKSDLYCARLLAGWETPHTGGKCPLLNSLPEQHRPAFKTFAERLFLLHIDYVHTDVIEILTVSQVMWYGKYNAHPYFMRFLKYETHETLLVWSKFLHQTFQAVNAVSIPMQLEDDDALPTVFSTLSAVKESMVALKEQQSRLEQQQVREEQRSDTIASVLATVKENQEAMMQKQNAVLELLLSARKRVRDSGATEDGSITMHKKCSRLIQSQIATSNAQVSPLHKEQTSLPEITSFQDLVMKWYARKLFKHSPGNDRQKKSAFNKIKRGIQYSKRFMTNDTTREIVISSQGKTEVTYAAEIGKLAAIAQRNILEFLMRVDIRAIWYSGDPSKPMRKDMLTKGAFWANLKRLDAVAKYDNALLPAIYVNDSAEIDTLTL
jgi:hypothetical protein